MLKLMTKIILIHLDGLPFGAVPCHSAKGNSRTFIFILWYTTIYVVMLF